MGRCCKPDIVKTSAVIQFQSDRKENDYAYNNKRGRVNQITNGKGVVASFESGINSI